VATDMIISALTTSSCIRQGCSSRPYPTLAVMDSDMRRQFCRESFRIPLIPINHNNTFIIKGLTDRVPQHHNVVHYKTCIIWQNLLYLRRQAPAEWQLGELGNPPDVVPARIMMSCHVAS
jgi:hypothetical protein